MGDRACDPRRYEHNYQLPITSTDQFSLNDTSSINAAHLESLNSNYALAKT